MPVNIANNYPSDVSARQTVLLNKTLENHFPEPQNRKPESQQTKAALVEKFTKLFDAHTNATMQPMITRDQTALGRNTRTELEKAKTELKQSRADLRAKESEFSDLKNPNGIASQIVADVVSDSTLYTQFQTAYGVSGPHAKSELEKIAKQNAQAYFEALREMQLEEQRRALTNKAYQDYLEEKSLEYLRESLGASDKNVTELFTNRSAAIPPGTRISVGDMFHKTYITVQNSKDGGMTAEFDPRDPAARTKILDLIVLQNPPPGQVTEIELGASITATQAIGGVSPQNDLPTRKAAIDLMVKSTGLNGYRATAGSSLRHSMNPLSDIMIPEPANDPDKLLKNCFTVNPETGKRDKLKTGFQMHLDPKEYHDFCLQYRRWGGRRPEIHVKGLALDPVEQKNLQKLYDLWDAYSKIYEANQKRPGLDMNPEVNDAPSPRKTDEISVGLSGEKVRPGSTPEHTDTMKLGSESTDEFEFGSKSTDQMEIGQESASDDLSLSSDEEEKKNSFSISSGSSK